MESTEQPDKNSVPAEKNGNIPIPENLVPNTVEESSSSSSSLTEEEIQERITLGLGNPTIRYPIRYLSGKEGTTRTDRERPTHKCWYCPTVMYTKPTYQAHLSSHQESNPRKCDKCSWSTKYALGLTKHLRCHTEEYFLLKPVNRRRLPPSGLKPLKRGLKVSGRRKKNPKPPVVRKRALPYANRKTKSKPLFKCQDPLCPNQFYKRGDLEKHMRALHSTAKKRFNCQLCTYNTKREWTLMGHLERHAANEGGAEGGPLQGHQQQQQQKPPTNSSLVNRSRKRNNSRVYRPGWFVALQQRRRRGRPNSKNRLNNSSSSRNGKLPPFGLIKQLSREEQRLIRIGNPKFSYPTTVTYTSGLVKRTTLRCYHCPAAFNNLRTYMSHQGKHRKERVGNKPMRGRGTLTTTMSRDSREPPAAASALDGLKVVGEIEEYDVIFSSTSASSSAGKRGRWGSGGGDKVLSKPNVEKEENVPIIMMTHGGNGTILIKSEPNSHANLEAQEEVPPTPSNKISYLITKVEMFNFMCFDEDDPYIYNTSPSYHNLSLLQGDYQGGKTACIVASLLGLGYDIRLELPENATLCGIVLNNMLSYGKSEGWIDITFNLKSYPTLYVRYGQQLILRRRFSDWRPLSESEFEISYHDVVWEQITREDVVGIWNKLIPTFILRLIVLNAENLKYFRANFSALNDIFHELVELRVKRKKEAPVTLVKLQRDLSARISRIKQLENNVLRLIGDEQFDEYIKVIQNTQRKELDDSRQWYEIMETKYKLVLEDDKIPAGPYDDSQLHLICEMRTPFREYLRLQAFVGDIVLDHSREELVIWLRASPVAAEQEEPFQQSITPDEARAIWKALPGKQRELGLIGLFFSFWKVLGHICPVIISDGYSSSEMEFQLQYSALCMFFRTTCQLLYSQIVLSAPGTSDKDFLGPYSANETFVAFCQRH